MIPGEQTTPIEHVVIIHKENRSFDHYFGKFPGANGATTGEMSDGTVIDLVPALDPMPNDVGHDNEDWVAAYNGGRMNGFDRELGAFSETGYPLAYSQMSESQIPAYWAYARRYGLGDHMFHDWKGASFGNHLFRMAAQSGREEPNMGNRAVFGGVPVGVIDRRLSRWGCDNETTTRVTERGADLVISPAWPCFSFEALPNILSDHGVTWHFYADSNDLSFHFNSLDAIASVRFDPALWSNVVPLSTFEADATAGRLPSVTWVQPVNTEHAPSTACAGENESVKYVNAVMNGPLWSSTVIIITWDEWGGFYDHVVPPQVDDVSFGFRIPLLVISPFVKYGSGSDGGYVNSTIFSHASPLKLVETNWGLPNLTSRDAGSNDMLDFFDFEQAPKQPLVLGTRECPPLTPEAQRIVDSWTVETID